MQVVSVLLVTRFQLRGDGEKEKKKKKKKAL